MPRVSRIQHLAAGKRKERVTDHPEADARRSARSPPPTLSPNDAADKRLSAIVEEISRLKQKDDQLSRRIDDLAAEVDSINGIRVP